MLKFHHLYENFINNFIALDFIALELSKITRMIDNEISLITLNSWDLRNREIFIQISNLMTV